jgi:general secretion pathway protein D
VLFDRSQIVDGTLRPGYNFNNQPLGNSIRSLDRSHVIGTQGLTDFSLGRVNPTLGYGGLVLSASSESVSVLIRALQLTRRLEVLGRPQIMTLDNQPAFIQVGARVPRIVGSRLVDRVQTNIVELENVGLILGVTPRISPEGMVVMEIDAERSRMGPESEGVPISFTEDGVIRSPQIEVTTAQTTVSALSGETIVLGGLITKSTDKLQRGVPYLSNLPLVGALFRYEFEEGIRTELLIFMTPHVIRSRQDAERIKQVEAARMSWCLADVHAIHGPTGLYEDADGSCWVGPGQVIYPARNPEGLPPGDYSPRPIPLEDYQIVPMEELPVPAREPTWERAMPPLEPLPAPAGRPTAHRR